jgi:hypothetical protein
MRTILYGFAAALLFAAPAVAADNCEQQLKDAKTAYAGSTIAPKSYARAGDLLKDAEAQCTAGKNAEAIALLRQVRLMIGE